MGILDKLFQKASMRDNDAVALTNKAFHLVEQGRYEEAINLLKKVIELYPSYGHAYNELAFIYGKGMNDLDTAEGYARRAIECEPNNPKFYGTINGIQIARVKQLRSKRDITESMNKYLNDLQDNIVRNPEYPPTYMAKAVAIAFKGEPQSKWESELDHAKRLYLKSGMSGAGIPLTSHMIDDIITRSRAECIEMQNLWKKAPS